jgi:F0F1-type ATP synthase assembly protein I
MSANPEPQVAEKRFVAWRNIYLILEAGLLVALVVFAWLDHYAQDRELVLGLYLIVGLVLGLSWAYLQVRQNARRKVWGAITAASRSYLPYLIPAIFVLIWIIFQVFD